MRAIELYQNHLSPRKGFRCAYGVLHDGNSCSQVVKHRVLDVGVRGLWGAMRHQFALCGEAATVLHAQNSNASPNQKRHRWKRKRNANSSDKSGDWCDAAQCACQLPDIASCCARVGCGVGKSGGSANDCSPCDGDVCGVDCCGGWP